MKLRIAFRLPRAMVAITACSFLSSCAHTYELRVNAFSKPRTAEAVSYRIRNLERRDVDIIRKEAEAFVKVALTRKGMHEAPDASSADIILDIDYGIEPPCIRYEISSMPVYAQEGGDAKTVRVAPQVTVSTPFSSSQVPAGVYDVTQYEPQRTELMGYREIATPVVIYEKYLQIVARENKPAAEGKPAENIWSVHVSSEDDSRDLRKYLPVLASAGIDYIGRNSESEKTVTLRDDDERVALVKKGM